MPLFFGGCRALCSSSDSMIEGSTGGGLRPFRLFSGVNASSLAASSWVFRFLELGELGSPGASSLAASSWVFRFLHLAHPLRPYRHEEHPVFAFFMPLLLALAGAVGGLELEELGSTEDLFRFLELESEEPELESEELELESEELESDPII